MIVGCPSCGRRYRLDAARIAPGKRLRCAGCGSVFDAAGPPASEGSAAPAGPLGGALALIADEPREFRELVSRVLIDLGCRVETTDDGEAAFRFAVARRPAIMVLNVYLRKLLGVAVCEGVKGSPDLKTTKVVLVGTVFKSGRFVRAPGNLYGADDYFENVVPAAEVRARLARLLRGAAPPFHEERLDPDVEIRRLARIMISDLKMYYPDEFQQALAARRFSETFREELAQAKELIARRFPDLPERLALLTAALKEGLGRERADVAGEAARR